MKIGETIKQRRKKLGLSVDELATRLGKNRATIYRYENGDIESLPITVLEPLAKALQTTPAELLGMQDEVTTEYYIDPVVNAKAEYARAQEGILLDAAKDLSDEDLDYVIDLVNRLRGK